MKPRFLRQKLGEQLTDEGKHRSVSDRARSPATTFDGPVDLNASHG
jgi:hypothetical protein